MDDIQDVLVSREAGMPRATGPSQSAQGSAGSTRKKGHTVFSLHGLDSLDGVEGDVQGCTNAAGGRMPGAAGLDKSVGMTRRDALMSRETGMSGATRIWTHFSAPEGRATGRSPVSRHGGVPVRPEKSRT